MLLYFLFLRRWRSDGIGIGIGTGIGIVGGGEGSDKQAEDPGDCRKERRRTLRFRNPRATHELCTLLALLSFMAPQEEDNAYDLLGITMEATEGEIRTAYRQRSLKVHPDRVSNLDIGLRDLANDSIDLQHPNNPQAAQKFHELNQAYELVLDPIRRLALDAKVRLKEAHKLRFAKFDNKRKGMQQELEEAEREFKRRKEDDKKKGKMREEENERVKEEGRKMREEAELKAAERATSAAKAAAATPQTEQGGEQGPLDTTVRLKYAVGRYPELVTAAALGRYMRRFGEVDEGSIVISTKAPKKSPDKPAKTVVALVPFTKVGDAFAAICARGKEDGGLKDMDVVWAGGHEPEAVRWLQTETVSALLINDAELSDGRLFLRRVLTLRRRRSCGCDKPNGSG